jgi:hypothetical protein
MLVNLGKRNEVVIRMKIIIRKIGNYEKKFEIVRFGNEVIVFKKSFWKCQRMIYNRSYFWNGLRRTIKWVQAR